MNIGSIGQKAKWFRIRKGLGLRAAAAALDISPSFLSDFELGRRAADADTLARICQAYGVPFENVNLWLRLEAQYKLRDAWKRAKEKA